MGLVTSGSGVFGCSKKTRGDNFCGNRREIAKRRERERERVRVGEMKS